MITIDLIDLERSMSRSLRLRMPFSHKGAELGHMLLLDTTREPYMGSPITLPHLPLRGFERRETDLILIHGWRGTVRDNPAFRFFSLQQYVFTHVHVCRKLPFFIPTGVVKQNSKVHGPLVFVFFNIGPNASDSFKPLLLL